MGLRILQVAVKLYEGMTTWNTCELNVQIDSDGDNKVDQEIRVCRCPAYQA